MKIAAIYNTFDGLELLEGSIQCIRDVVDVVIVVDQVTSNWGNVQSEKQKKYLKNIPDRYIDEYILFTPNRGQGYVNAMKNETKKRQIGIDRAKELQCDYFLLLDVDEYYDTSEFSNAVDSVVKSNLTGSYCKMYTYIKRPTFRLEDPDDYYVPFIHKLEKNTQCGRNFHYPVTVDPTRKISNSNRENTELLPIMMHHYSWVREYITTKMKNSTARNNIYNENVKAMYDTCDSTMRWNGKKIIEVENIFGIEI